MTMLEPVLYILMRTDLKSMNPGKGMAQAAHAQAVFTTHMHRCYNVDMEPENTLRVVKLYKKWREQTAHGFGTTIVLDAGDEGFMRHILDQVKQHESVVTGVVHDPTYPIRDGKAMHYIPCNTCAFVFIDKAQGIGQLINLGLR